MTFVSTLYIHGDLGLVPVYTSFNASIVLALFDRIHSFYPPPSPLQAVLWWSSSSYDILITCILLCFSSFFSYLFSIFDPARDGVNNGFSPAHIQHGFGFLSLFILILFLRHFTYLFSTQTGKELLPYLTFYLLP